MSQPQTRSFQYSTQPQPRGRVLFIHGVADDGLIHVTTVAPPALGGASGSEVVNQLIRGSILGNLYCNVTVPGLVSEHVILVGAEQQAVHVQTPNVIINCILDFDKSKEALKKAEQLIAHLQSQAKNHIPVINPPAAVRATSREQISETFGHLPGFIMPRTIRVAPVSVADTIQKIEASGMKLPVLMRPVGAHGGDGMIFIGDFSDTTKLALERYAFDGSDYYLTEWMDFKSRDGLYRKARLVSVGGTFIMRHCIVQEGWNTHSSSRGGIMTARPELRAEEEKLLTTPLQQFVSAEAWQSLQSIYHKIGLDYFGIDCNITDDGRILVFEINAAFNSMVQNQTETIFSYLDQPVKQIIQAFNDLIAYKATLVRAA